MIIEEFLKNDVDRYSEGNYDYLFKHKPKTERGQKHTEKKETHRERKQQKKDPGQGKKRRHILRGSFGMFDRNKKKNMPGISDPSSDLPTEQEPVDNTPTNEKIQQEITNTGSESETASEDQSQEDQSSYNEPSETKKTEPKEADKPNKLKEVSYGAWVGLSFLGLTILLAGYAVLKAGKHERPTSSHNRKNSGID